MLAFTVFPLGYSLYLAFYKIEQQDRGRRAGRCPMLDEAGKPVLDATGKPRTKNVVAEEPGQHRDLHRPRQLRAACSATRRSREAVRVTAIFVLVAVPLRAGPRASSWPSSSTSAIFGRPVLRTIMILPIFATPIAVGYSFFTIFYEDGGPLGWTGIPFLSNPHWALVSVILVDVWQWTPFCFLVFLAALQGVPDELFEAARIDGASAVDILHHVLLPVLQPTIIIVLLLRLAESLKVFDIPFALTGGGPGIATQSYSLLAFRTGLRFFDLGYASAMAYGLLIVVMVIITFFFRRLRETYG